MIPVEVVVAVDAAMGIGKDGTIPWRLPGDIRHFKSLTEQTDDPAKRNAVIMGRITWESLPPKFQPLPGRVNVVLTRRADYVLPDAVHTAAAFDDALALLDAAAATPRIETAFVIGGAAVYRAALDSTRCVRVHLTRIQGDFACDTFLEGLPAAFVETEVGELRMENGLTYRIDVLTRR